MRARGGDGGSFVMQLNFTFIFDAAPSTRCTVAAVSRLTRLLKSIAIDSPPFRLNRTSQLFILFFFFCSKGLQSCCSPCSPCSAAPQHSPPRLFAAWSVSQRSAINHRSAAQPDAAGRPIYCRERKVCGNIHAAQSTTFPFPDVALKVVETCRRGGKDVNRGLFNISIWEGMRPRKEKKSEPRLPAGVR